MRFFHVLGKGSHGGKIETEYRGIRIEIIKGLRTYSFLGQFARTLVFAVAKEFDDSALIRGEAE